MGYWNQLVVLSFCRHSCFRSITFSIICLHENLHNVVYIHSNRGDPYWFWGQAINLLSLSSTFQKTYTWTSAIWRMILIYFGVKQSKVKVIVVWHSWMVSDNNLLSLSSTSLKTYMWTLTRSKMIPICVEIKLAKVKVKVVWHNRTVSRW